MTLLAIVYLIAAHFSELYRPVPHPLVGVELPPGAVARLGPDAFRYAGWVNVLHNGGPTLWYAPDGKRVAATSSAGVDVWDAVTGKRLLRVASGKLTVIGCLGFHSSGDVMVDTRRRWDDGGCGIFRIDPSTGKVRARYQPTEERRFAAVSSDGKIVYSRTQANDMEAENIANEIDSGKELWRRKMPGMSWLRVSPDGSRLVVWSSRAKWELDVLDAATGKIVERLTHSEDDSSPAWTTGGVAVGVQARRIVGAHEWDRGFSVFEAGTEKPAFREAGPWYSSVFLTRDSKRLAAIRGRGNVSIEVWDLDARKKLSSVLADVGRTMTLAPDGATICTADARSAPGTLQFFDVATGKRRPRSPEPFTQAAMVWYLPDGTLASADEKLAKPVKWDLKSGAMTPLPAGAKPPAASKPGPDFRPPAGTDRVVVAPGAQRAIGYRFDPDELDSSPGDTYLGLFDGSGSVVKKYLRIDHTGGASWAFSPDGRRFAAARGDGTITLFDSDSGKELRTFLHAGSVSSMAYSPDGRFLATACGDGPLLVWDTRGR